MRVAGFMLFEESGFGFCRCSVAGGPNSMMGWFWKWILFSMAKDSTIACWCFLLWQRSMFDWDWSPCLWKGSQSLAKRKNVFFWCFPLFASNVILLCSFELCFACFWKFLFSSFSSPEMAQRNWLSCCSSKASLEHLSEVSPWVSQQQRLFSQGLFAISLMTKQIGECKKWTSCCKRCWLCVHFLLVDFLIHSAQKWDCQILFGGDPCLLHCCHFGFSYAQLLEGDWCNHCPVVLFVCFESIAGLANVEWVIFHNQMWLANRDKHVVVSLTSRHVMSKTC